MIKTEHIEVWGFKHAIRGMRNPMNSWAKSDSQECKHCTDCKHMNTYDIGPSDMALMQKLFKAGTEHRKFLRQIFVSMDITAPLYWWKEFDTYQVGTTRDSCSTMHKLVDREFTESDFSFDKCSDLQVISHTFGIVTMLNKLRVEYLQSKDKKVWYQMIQILPESYNQKRTVTMNYENVFNIIRQRTGHKLNEWNEFVKVLKDLPYVKEIGELK